MWVTRGDCRPIVDIVELPIELTIEQCHIESIIACLKNIIFHVNGIHVFYLDKRHRCTTPFDNLASEIAMPYKITTFLLTFTLSNSEYYPLTFFFVVDFKSVIMIVSESSIILGRQQFSIDPYHDHKNEEEYGFATHPEISINIQTMFVK